MITINNYSEKEKSINWSDMPQAVSKNRNDVVGMFDLYGEDPDIDKTIDTWLSLLNQNTGTTMKKVSKKKPVKKAAPKKKVAKKATEKPKKRKLNKKVDVTFVDAYSEEFKLLRRFRNTIKKETLTFRQLRLLYMAFNKAVVARKVRKQAENADEFTKANAGITKLFSQVKDKNLDDEKLLKIDIENESLVNEINKFVDNTKINYAVSLLRSFIGMQGTKPATDKVERLLKRFENGIEKKRVTKDNRLYDQVKDAVKEMKEYLENPEEKIDVDMYGLSVPKCQNRVKCEGLKPSGKLKPGYKFIKGGDVVPVKKKSKDHGLNYPMVIEEETDDDLAVLDDDFETEIIDVSETIEQPEQEEKTVATVHEAKVIEHQEPTPEPPKLPSRKNSKIRNMADKSERAFEFYNVPGETGKFLQRVERKPKGSVAITLSAPKGAGKTTLMYQMMNDFAAGKNPCLFVSLEEDPESVLAEDKRNKYIDEANRPYIDEVGEINSKQELYDLIEQYDVVFIDSWQKLIRLFKILFDEGRRK